MFTVSALSVKKTFGVLVVGLVLTSCSKETDSGTKISTEGLPSTPISELVLAEADFPDGFQFQAYSKEQLKQGTAQLVNTFKAAKVTPEKCSALLLEANDELAKLVDTTATIFAINMQDSASFSSSVYGADIDIDKQKSGMFGDCAKLNMIITTEGTEVNSQTVNTTVDLSPEFGEKAFAVKQEINSSVKEKVSKTVSYTGYAAVRGVTVSLEAKTYSAEKEPDRTQFLTLFSKAIAKVKNAQ
ncbi:MAG: hypothetical protein ACRCSF_11675 [Mycobacteriaceae bacterium]